jgi:mevalonate kinase
LYCQLDVKVVAVVKKKEERGNDEQDNDNDNNNKKKKSKKNPVILYLHLPKELGGKSKKYDLSNLPPSPPPPPPPSDDDDKESRQSPEPPPDFALAAIHEVIKEGYTFDSLLLLLSFTTDEDRLVEVHCTSLVGQLPIQAGCSSSTSFLVGWILLLSKLAGRDQELLASPIRLAELAHRAEVVHFGHPGGTMDHVSIALGTVLTTQPGVRDGDGDGGCCGAIRIGPGPWQVERLPSLWSPSTADSTDGNDAGEEEDNGVWILADSGEPKDTFKHLKRCKYDRLQLLKEKLHNDWDYNQKKDVANDLKENVVSPTEKQLWDATIINRNTERSASELWRRHKSHANTVSSSSSTTSSSSSSSPSCRQHDRQQPQHKSVGHSLALLMKEHHEALRDGLGLSTPRLEAINDAATKAGAWGFKVVGSGGGGCGIAWCPTSKAEAVSQRMKEAGAIGTWIFHHRKDQPPVRGARIL